MAASWRRTTTTVVGVLVLVACGSGPEPVADGSYKFYAESGVGNATTTELEISGAELTIDSAGTELRVNTIPGEESYVLCPSEGEGIPLLVDQEIQLGEVTLTSPAIFGDCGETSPRRVTIVDLDSAEEGSLPAFAVWAEFCVSDDPDC